ncbi:MAG: hypothetical protein ACKV2O_25185 [Acidimicrobiales bacterium]
MAGCSAEVGDPDGDGPANLSPLGSPAEQGGGAKTASTGLTSRPGGSGSDGTGGTVTAGSGGPSNGCATLGAIPAGVTTGSNLRTDMDGDGRADTVGTYRSVSGEQWRLRVAFAAGGGSELVLSVEPGPAMVAALGSAPLGPATQSRPVLFVATGSGASSRTVELFTVDGCEVVALTDASGASPSFVIGASLGHQEGLRCQLAGGQQMVVEVLSVTASAGGFSVTERSFARDGNLLLANGAATTQSPTPPPEAGRIAGCGDVTL